MGTTKINWANKVWNPITGCTKISEGCENCYAARMAKRLAGRFGYPADDPFRPGVVHEDKLAEPLNWKKPSRVFVCSMGDIFHEHVSAITTVNIFQVMQAAKHHTFILLTKRPEIAEQRIAGMDFCNYIKWPLPNVWLGVTAENQQRADERIPILLQIPAAVRFVSVEPMLGPVDIYDYMYVVGTVDPPVLGRGLDWVICGGETGPGARLMLADWAKSLRAQCVAAGVPYFLKKTADGGRLLDGQEWNQYPEVV
jgi:protein gp37